MKTTNETISSDVQISQENKLPGYTLLDEVKAKGRKKVAIVGFAPSWQQAPYGDDSYEIWCLNELYLYLDPFPGARYNRWFEVHTMESIKASERALNGEYLKHLAGLNCPVYAQAHFDEIPNSIPYPLKEIVAEFKPTEEQQDAYLTNSISFMIALAVHEGFEEISVFGVDMAQDSEYCVSPETRVLTADLHWILASEVQVGQELMAFDEEPRCRTEKEGKYRQWCKATVERADKLTRPCYRLHMADGTTLVCSAEHRWLVNSSNTQKWAQTDQLQPSEIYPERSSKIVKVLNTWEADNSYGAGYLAAAFDGEGSLCQSPHRCCTTGTFRLSFSQKPNDMSSFVKQELEVRGYKFTEISKNDCHHYAVNGGRPEIARFLGQIRPKRLLSRFDPNTMGVVRSIGDIPVVKAEFIGEASVIGLKTSAGTFVAEGFASHNSAQRPSCEYHMGIAKGRGIKTYVPKNADLLKQAFLYGYEDQESRVFDEKLGQRLKDMQNRHTEGQARHENIVMEINQYLGAVSEFDKLKKEITDVGVLAKMDERIMAFRKKINELQNLGQKTFAEMNQYLGAIQDCEHWKRNWRSL